MAVFSAAVVRGTRMPLLLEAASSIALALGATEPMPVLPLIDIAALH